MNSEEQYKFRIILSNNNKNNKKKHHNEYDRRCDIIQKQILTESPEAGSVGSVHHADDLAEHPLGPTVMELSKSSTIDEFTDEVEPELRS